jgi:hypothetical protein
VSQSVFVLVGLPKCCSSNVLMLRVNFRFRRDLVAMMSTVDPLQISQNIDLYANLFNILASQVTTMEQDFFEVSIAFGDDLLSFSCIY